MGWDLRRKKRWEEGEVLYHLAFSVKKKKRMCERGQSSRVNDDKVCSSVVATEEGKQKTVSTVSRTEI